MNIVGYISRGINKGKALPRSVRTMRAMAIVGMALAVAALIVAVSIGRGFENQYRKSLLDFNAHLIVMGAGEIPNPDDLLTSIEGWRGDVSATPFLYREALAIGGGVHGVVIKGLLQGALGDMNVSPLDPEVNVDSLLSGEGNSVDVVVGHSFMKKIEKNLSSDTFKIMIPSNLDGELKGGKFIKLHPVATFDTGMHDYDSQFILMNLNDSRRIFGAIPNTLVSGIEIRLVDPYAADELIDGLKKELGPAYRVVSWSELNEDLLGAVHLERFVFAGIMVLLVIVAAMNIVAVLALITIHRKTSVSILKSLGLKDRDIVRIFIGQGVFIGAWGAFLGLSVGVAISWLTGHFGLVPLEAEVYLVESLPIDISAPLCAFIALFCLGVAYAISAFAAKRLVLMPITDGLQGYLR